MRLVGRMELQPILVNNETGIEESSEVFSTTELIQVKKSKDGKETRTYKTSVIGIACAHCDNPKQGRATDPTYSVRADIFIYWNNHQKAGRIYADFIETKGYYTILDSGVSVQKQTVLFKAKGVSAMTYGPYSKSATYYPTSSSWRYYSPYPTSWDPVAAGNQKGTTSAIGRRCLFGHII